MTVTRIAMWSGPRNISTAMLRAFENRPDTVVVDEPLYAHYLLETRIDHPGRDEVLAAHETDCETVIQSLLGPVPAGKTVFYQKHMAHHLLPHIDRGWLTHLTHALLIRDPQEMITSLVKNLPEPTLADTGLPQQRELLDHLNAAGITDVPILDAKDVLQHPREMLEALCEKTGIAFSDKMLSWPPGRRDTDGIWAKHWYHAVEKSTGFKPYEPKNEDVPPQLRGLLEQAVAQYEPLYEQRLRPS